MVGSGVGARNGILFKTAVSLEEAGNVCAPWCWTRPAPSPPASPGVTDILPATGVTAAGLLSLAAALERGSGAPLARAVLQKAEEEGLALQEVQDFRALPGNGLTAALAGQELAGGSLKFHPNHSPGAA
jgi:Cu2+-exporting ATPase